MIPFETFNLKTNNLKLEQPKKSQTLQAIKVFFQAHTHTLIWWITIHKPIIIHF